jgi:glycosyltransferase involved in cell wall biosynthesis
VTSDRAICTIFAKNYLPQARILAESYLAQHPAERVFGLLCDRLEGRYDPQREQFETILVEDLHVPRFTELTIKYSIVELLTAVKPFFLQYLFEKYDLAKLCYFDPDILFLSSIESIWQKLDTFNVVLTPHMVEPQRLERTPSERTMLSAGAYNLGFIGLRRSAETDRLLDWWGKKLLDHGYSDPSRNLFVDQRWVDLVPGMFDGVWIHRDPGCNVAYWNLSERPIIQRGDKFYVKDSPLKFFHFSGYSHRSPDRISRHVPPELDKLSLEDLGDGARLFEIYHALLLKHGAIETERWPFAFDHLPTGQKIPSVARNLWRQAFENGELSASASLDDCIAFATQAADSHQPPINRLAEWIYLNRLDVRQAFPDIRHRHRVPFITWYLNTGVKEHCIPDVLIGRMRDELTQRLAADQMRAMALRQRIARIAGLPLRVRRAIGRLPIVQRLFLSLRAASWVKRLCAIPRLYRLRRFFYPELAAPAVPPPAASSPERSFSAQRGLNVLGYLSAETGVGELPRAIIRALQHHGYPVSITHLDNPDGARRNDKSVLDLPEGTPYSANLFSVNSDGWASIKQILDPRIIEGRKNIGFWFWEIAHFPEEWIDRFDKLDEIWAGSLFIQEAIGAVSPIPVVKIGVPIVLRPPSLLSRRELNLPEDKFVFLYAFDMLSIPERKNPLAVVEAYRLAFEPYFKDTHLVLKANHLHRFPEWQARLRQAVASVQGALIEQTLDREHLNALYQLTDVYVSLHRSEGFGLTVAETMRMGKPVIATDYGGTRDFLNQNNGYPVRYRLVELEQDYGPYRAGNVWADPDVEHAAELMRWVFEHPEDRTRKGQQAAQDIERLYGPAVMADRIIRRLERFY